MFVFASWIIILTTWCVGSSQSTLFFLLLDDSGHQFPPLPAELSHSKGPWCLALGVFNIIWSHTTQVSQSASNISKRLHLVESLWQCWWFFAAMKLFPMWVVLIDDISSELVLLFICLAWSFMWDYSSTILFCIKHLLFKKLWSCVQWLALEKRICMVTKALSR